MDAAATLVWMAPEPPDAEQSRSLASWSRAHGVRLMPAKRSEAPVLALDMGIAEAVETQLDRIRDAIAARDAAITDRALSSAESILRAHAELPQAAWLMAEVERARASRWRRIEPTDLEAAQRSWQRAEALDGGRLAGLGEESSAEHAPPANIVLDLLPRDAPAWIDGRPARGTVDTRAGLHALAVTWEGVPVWAAWIDAPEGTSTWHVSAPVAAPCSAADLGRARPSPDGSTDAGFVRCPSWVAATGGAGAGVVRVARCEGDRCGPSLEWRPALSWTWSPPPESDRRGNWPAWATWSLVGAGAAIAAGVAILASGALQAAPSETRFVSGGIRTQ